MNQQRFHRKVGNTKVIATYKDFSSKVLEFTEAYFFPIPRPKGDEAEFRPDALLHARLSVDFADMIESSVLADINEETLEVEVTIQAKFVVQKEGG